MNKEIIRKYFSGQCSTEETVEFLKWIKSSESDEELSAYLQQYWHAMDDESTEKTEVLKKLHRRMNKKSSKTKSIPLFWKIAASLIIIALITFSIIKFSDIKPQYTKQEVIASELITKSTENGQKLRINLPDGSRVVLNSASVISYPANFSDSLRKVVLSGEAFFDVEEAEKPFVVFTDKISTTVLGTSFNVRYRENENQIEVSLLSGRIKVDDENDGHLQLLPGDRAIYHMEKNELEKEKYDYLQNFGWKDGLLHFNNASLDKIKQELEMWYGVQINIADRPDEPRHFTGAFENQSLKNVMESLSFTFGFKYELDEKNVFIQF